MSDKIGEWTWEQKKPTRSEIPQMHVRVTERIGRLVEDGKHYNLVLREVPAPGNKDSS